MLSDKRDRQRKYFNDVRLHAFINKTGLSDFYHSVAKSNLQILRMIQFLILSSRMVQENMYTVFM